MLFYCSVFFSVAAGYFYHESRPAFSSIPFRSGRVFPPRIRCGIYAPLPEPVAVKALERARETGGPAAALELEDGRIITGKTTNLLGASAALLLNVLKELAGLDHGLHIISPESIEPIQKLKVDYLKSKNPRLHTDEVLIALSASAATNPDARLALSQLPKLEGCQAHTSVMLSDVDIKIFKKLGVQLTCEAVYEHTIL